MIQILQAAPTALRITTGSPSASRGREVPVPTVVAPRTLLALTTPFAAHRHSRDLDQLYFFTGQPFEAPQTLRNDSQALRRGDVDWRHAKDPPLTGDKEPEAPEVHLLTTSIRLPPARFQVLEEELLRQSRHPEKRTVAARRDCFAQHVLDRRVSL